FRHIKDVVFEILTNDAHPGDEAIRQNLRDWPAFGQRVFGHLLDLLGFAFVKALIHKSVIRHTNYLTQRRKDAETQRKNSEIELFVLACIASWLLQKAP